MVVELASDSLRRSQPKLVAGLSSQLWTSVIMKGFDVKVYGPEPAIALEPLMVAAKSPPGVAQGEPAVPNLLFHVAPATPKLPAMSLPFPSAQLASSRFRSKTEATPKLGVRTTVRLRLAELMMAPAGRFPAMSNSSSPRVMPPPRRPPEVKLVPSPKFESGR